MADDAGRSWGRIVKQVAPRLPGGGWRVGRPGPRAILARRNSEWDLTWVGLDRVRGTSTPWLIAGVVSLVGPFRLTYGRGLRSDHAHPPGTVDLLRPDAAEAVERFIVDEALPVVDAWPAERMAADAEAQWAKPPSERSSRLRYPEAAGWRVVTDGESPLEVATEAAAEFRSRLAPEETAWYEDLAAAWQAGGRPAALAYLVEQRDTALSKLKLL